MKSVHSTIRTYKGETRESWVVTLGICFPWVISLLSFFLVCIGILVNDLLYRTLYDKLRRVKITGDGLGPQYLHLVCDRIRVLRGSFHSSLLGGHGTGITEKKRPLLLRSWLVPECGSGEGLLIEVVVPLPFVSLLPDTTRNRPKRTSFQ